jgi:uncharacterized protein
VSQPRYPLRINVGFIINQPIGTSRDIHFDFPSLSLPPDFDMIDFQGVVRVNRTPQALLLQGNFKAKESEQCVRCLTRFWQPLHGEFEELYALVPPRHGGIYEKDNEDSESELILPDDANVDMAPLVRELLLLEVPISPLCKPDCKGLCPECGADLNGSPCEHVLNQAESGPINGQT